MPLMACPPRWGCAPRGRLAGTRYGRTDQQAKGNFKAALAGYALAVLAPVILEALQGILGG